MRELRGVRIAITRPEEEGRRLQAALEALGAEVLVAPAIRRLPPASWEPLDAAIRNLGAGAYQGLLFTSPAGVAAFAERQARLGVTLPASLFLGAVGRSTARAMEAVGLAQPVVPRIEEGRWLAEAVAQALGPALRGMRFLQPRAAGGREELSRGLAAHGAQVEVVDAYRIEAATAAELLPLTQALAAGALDAVIFASPSAVRAVRATAPAGLGRARPIAIGETTAGALRAWGQSPRVADEASDEGLLRAVQAAFRPA